MLENGTFSPCFACFEKDASSLEHFGFVSSPCVEIRFPGWGTFGCLRTWICKDNVELPGQWCCQNGHCSRKKSFGIRLNSDVSLCVESRRPLYIDTYKWPKENKKKILFFFPGRQTSWNVPSYFPWVYGCHPIRNGTPTNEQAKCSQGK